MGRECGLLASNFGSTTSTRVVYAGIDTMFHWIPSDHGVNQPYCEWMGGVPRYQRMYQSSVYYCSVELSPGFVNALDTLCVANLDGFTLLL